MKTKNFLELLLADEGHYCVFAAKGGAPKQSFYSSVDDVLDAAHGYDAGGYDVYFALATLETAGSRKADNVRGMKSFFLDLDCGEGKEFPRPRDCYCRTTSFFCKRHKLPNPTLVNSGRGVHVYWILSELICKDDWLPVAERLKQLCKEDGFEADPSVTSDVARVLRIPSTHNHKGTPPIPVTFYGVEEPRNYFF